MNRKPVIDTPEGRASVAHIFRQALARRKPRGGERMMRASEEPT